MKNIVLLTTLDTKGQEARCLKEYICEHGFEAITVDIGTGKAVEMSSDISAQEVASVAGEDIESLRKSTDRPRIADIMTRGASNILNHLPRKPDGVIAIGGMSTTAMAANIMESLPIAIPKLIVSSAASMPGSNRYFGPSGITLMHSLFDIGDLNSLLKAQLAKAAAAICAMADSQEIDFKGSKPLVAISSYGYIEHCVHHVCQALGSRYEVVRFHATGAPEISMEKLVEEDTFVGLIDLVPSSITNNVLKGSRTSWDQRMEIPAKKGLPQVISLAGVNTISSIGKTEEILKPQLAGRRYYFMDTLRATVWLDDADIQTVTSVYADKINLAAGPVCLVVPLKGFLSIEKPGSPHFDEKSNLMFIKELENKLKPSIKVIKVDANIDETVFADVLVSAFNDVMSKGREDGRN